MWKLYEIPVSVFAIKFFWNTATLPRYHIVCGCLHAAAAEVNSCSRGCMARRSENTCCRALRRKSWWPPILLRVEVWLEPGGSDFWPGLSLGLEQCWRWGVFFFYSSPKTLQTCRASLRITDVRVCRVHYGDLLAAKGRNCLLLSLLGTSQLSVLDPQWFTEKWGSVCDNETRGAALFGNIKY